MATEQTETVADEPAGRFIGLEVLRCIAAFAVLVWHYRFFRGGGGEGGADTAPFRDGLALFYAFGEYGVHLFWCLSGFIFAWKYAASIGLGLVSFRRFAVLRFSRLYPLHFATLIAVAVLQIAYGRTHGAFFVYENNDLRHFLLNLAFASYWGLQDGLSFNGPSWSVSTEILVYLFFFAQSRLTGGRRWLSTTVALTVFVVSALNFAVGLPHFPLPMALAYFYLGVVTFHLHTAIVARAGPERGVLNAAVWLAAALLGAGFWSGRLDFRAFPAPVLFLLLPTLILSLQLFMSDRFRRLDRLLMGLGNLTYASYLLHFPLQLAIVQILERLGLDATELSSSRGFFVLYILVVVVLSRIVFLGLERPAQAWLRWRLLAGRTRGVTFQATPSTIHATEKAGF